MIKPQILEAIRQMPNRERLEIIEFALRLVSEEIEKPEKLSLMDVAEIMRSYYVEGSDLTQFVDLGDQDFWFTKKADLASWNSERSNYAGDQ